MGMTSGLLNAVSGLDVNQTWMNVIGNNVSNSNTTAFKTSTVDMTPQFYVTDAAATAPSSTSGGTNPSQEGLGATVQMVQTNFAAGSIESTGVDTDMAINGAGFFVVQGQQQLYTQDGSFTLNAAHQLVNDAGDFVQGYGADANGNIQTGALQNLTIPLGTNQIAKATQNATMQGNLDASGTVATGSSILMSGDLTTVGGATTPATTDLLTNIASTLSPATPAFAVGQTITLQGTQGGRTLGSSTFTVTATSTMQDFMTFVQQGMGINTTGTPTTPPAGVTFEAGAAPNSMDMVITGNIGSQNAIEITGTGLTSSTGTAPVTFADGTDDAGFTSDPNGESVYTSFTAYDSLGNPVTVGVTAVLQSKSTAGNTWAYFANSPDSTTGGSAVGSGTLTFDNDGNLVSGSPATITIDRAGTGAASPLNVNLDFSSLTQLTGDQSTLTMSNQDGFPAGTLDSFSVGTDGTITGAYTNGETQTLGQVAVATFDNQAGLSNAGGNLYAATPASGAPQISGAGSGGAGVIDGSSLEQSNVDLSQEFTNMILASTGFSASSRVITTTDQMIQELLDSNH